MVVVIDAGHGGKDPGNLGTGRYKTAEKDITLAVAKKTAAYITERLPEVKVITVGVGVELSVRTIVIVAEIGLTPELVTDVLSVEMALGSAILLVVGESAGNVLPIVSPRCLFSTEKANPTSWMLLRRSFPVSFVETNLIRSSWPAPFVAVHENEIGVRSTCPDAPLTLPIEMLSTSVNPMDGEPLCCKTNQSSSLPEPTAEMFAVTMCSPGSRKRLEPITAEPELLSCNGFRK